LLKEFFALFLEPRVISVSPLGCSEISEETSSEKIEISCFGKKYSNTSLTDSILEGFPDPTLTIIEKC